MILLGYNIDVVVPNHLQNDKGFISSDFMIGVRYIK